MAPCYGQIRGRDRARGVLSPVMPRLAPPVLPPDVLERRRRHLTYEYRRSHVWLDDLLAERDPHAYDLCRRHADELSVPLGWVLTDRRLAVAVSTTCSPAERPQAPLAWPVVSSPLRPVALRETGGASTCRWRC